MDQTSNNSSLNLKLVAENMTKIIGKDYWNVDDVAEVLRTKSYDKLTVIQISSILKHYKSLGYHTFSSGTKPELTKRLTALVVELLNEIVALKKDQILRPTEYHDNIEDSVGITSLLKNGNKKECNDQNLLSVSPSDLVAKQVTMPPESNITQILSSINSKNKKSSKLIINRSKVMTPASEFPTSNLGICSQLTGVALDPHNSYKQQHQTMNTNNNINSTTDNHFNINNNRDFANTFYSNLVQPSSSSSLNADIYKNNINIPNLPLQTTLGHTSPTSSITSSTNSTSSSPHSPTFYFPALHPDPRLQPQYNSLSNHQDPKRLIFHDLCQSGFSKEQATYGINKCFENLSFENAMIAIISKQEEDLYNAEVDQAILVSEGEREVIQDRKRSRDEVLKNDCIESIRNAIEFQSSYLLGYSSIITNTNTNATTDTNATTEIVGVLADNRGELGLRENENNLIADTGSKVLQAAVTLCESSCCKDANKCRCHPTIVALRQSIISLLLTERNAIKWWHQKCFGYLKLVAARLDNSASSLATNDSSKPDSHEAIISPNKRSNDNYSKKRKLSDNNLQINKYLQNESLVNGMQRTTKSRHTDDVARKDILTILGINLDELVPIIDSEMEQLQLALYSMPEIEGGIPKAFIDADPNSCKDNPLILRLDEDGIECLS